MVALPCSPIWLEHQRQARSAVNRPARRSRITNAIERLHEEFKRRIKTQTALPSADTATMLFWALLASGQINMRKVDGWQTLEFQPIFGPHPPVLLATVFGRPPTNKRKAQHSVRRDNSDPPQL